jgi:deazaflavin-dependent oxidoreductase (nitroreductase family)
MPSSKKIRPPWWLKPLNKIFIRMSRLGLRFGGEGPVVLTVPGRKSGRPRSTPVTPMTVDGKEYVVGGFPGADWVQNVHAAKEATVVRGRRSLRVRMAELSADKARPLLGAWPIHVPTGVGVFRLDPVQPADMEFNSIE